MSGGENIKDTKNTLTTPIKDTKINLSYNRVNKLITALYIVTDILDRDEPVRYQLRDLGAKILSDIISIRHGLVSDRLKNTTIYTEQTISLIEVSSTVGLISEMNAGVLKKEFHLLAEALNDATNRYNPFGFGVNIESFFRSAPEDISVPPPEEKFKYFTKYPTHNPVISKGHSIGQNYRTKIGLQSGKTLLGALKEIKVPVLKDNQKSGKLERFNKIKSILKDNSSGLTISDIKIKLGEIVKDISEKTLQRELLSLTDQKVLRRVGEKRWSRYFLNS